MFSPEIYSQRRKSLRERMNGAYILITGHSEAPRNYKDNTYTFRQNSNFLYFAGHSIPDMALLMTPSEDILFGYNPTVDDIIWTGELPSLEELGKQCGIAKTAEISSLPDVIKSLSVKVHYLPPYRAEQKLLYSDLFGISLSDVEISASSELMKVVSDLRLKKTSEEIAEIEKALDASYLMYQAAASVIKPGVKEWDVMSAMESAALIAGCLQSFHPIVTVHGEVLHNHGYGNILPEKGLILLDSGAETSEGYASDITRTFPVSGKYSLLEKSIYETVLNAQLKAIELSAPGVSYKHIHLEAAKVIVEGLKDAGLMKGNIESAVEAGAHALFFPHGLGHMMGLDVHDMEDLGDIVGYGENLKRSSQFGLAFLRMARELEEGFVFTVEPGIYFIPALISRWYSEGLHKDFINYDKINEFKSFGGIRIEDDILVTSNGCRVLGKPIPKTVSEVESLMEKA